MLVLVFRVGCLFFVTFFFFLKLFTIEKPILYAKNYKQKRKTTSSTTHFTCPYGYWKPTPFVYSIGVPLPSPLAIQRLNQICQEILVFKTFSTCCHFLLCIVSFFFIVYWNFFLFLTLVISLIKDFNINDSDFLEL